VREAEVQAQAEEKKIHPAAKRRNKKKKDQQRKKKSQQNWNRMRKKAEGRWGGRNERG
jgi:hypothetical protein